MSSNLNFNDRLESLQRDNKIIQFLLEQNFRACSEYKSANANLARRQYRAKHPTEIAVFKCMDGRLNVAVITETPVGIIQPFRNIGGQFDMGWENFSSKVANWVEYSVDKGRDCLPIITYHFSKKSVHGGCAGHGYDTCKAMSEARKLVSQFAQVFGNKREIVHPILVGIETEEDSLILHGDKGTVFDVSKNLGMSADEVMVVLGDLYPVMKKVMRQDLTQLILGNMSHVEKLLQNPRAPIDNEHREATIAIGRGFDWLHVANKALIVGPYGYTLQKSIATAGSLILKNFKEGRINKEDGFVVMVSALYFKEGHVRRSAEEKALSLCKLAKEVLMEQQPELMKDYKVVFLAGVTSHDTREFTPIDHEVERSEPILSEVEKGAVAVPSH